jgi:hypothetical protein
MGCPYANILGVPGTGPHSYRLFGLAIFDTALTILVAAITTYFTGLPFLLSFLDWFLLGETLHWIFGTKTAFLKMFNMTPVCREDA